MEEPSQVRRELTASEGQRPRLGEHESDILLHDQEEGALCLQARILGRLKVWHWRAI